MKDRLASCAYAMVVLYVQVDEIRRDKPNQVLLLDAGNQAMGTLWFTMFGATIMPSFMNRLATTPCNLDLSKNKDLKSDIKPFTILKVGGERIGIVGFTTVETPIISRPGTIGFKPEIHCIKKVVKQLKGKGITKIIALGHSGYSMDKSIAQNVPDIDVIVGGLTETFLYTGTHPSKEKPDGPYPTVVKNPDGKKVLLVQDYAYGKYLGRLEVQFDKKGEIITWSGNPILLDKDVPRDPSILKFMKPFQKALKAQRNQVVGTASVFIEGDSSVCRKEECNMGNMITDAMVQNNRKQSRSPKLTKVFIAVLNGGGIRSSIDKGQITEGDILSVQPFRNKVCVVQMSGDTLYKALEFCASKRQDKGKLFGGFLQVSGLRIVYDMRKPVNQRVIDVKALCAECRIPKYKQLNKTKMYKVLMSEFLIEGGDGYQMFKNNTIKKCENGKLDSTIMKNYVKQYSPMAPALEGRIRFIDDTNENEFCLKSKER